MTREAAERPNRQGWLGAAPDPTERKRSQLPMAEIFRDLSERQVREIEQGLRTSTVNKGHIVYHPDETPEALFLLKTGRVQLYRISPEGKRFVATNIEPGMFFGEMAMIGQSMYGSFAEALEDCTLGVVSRQDLERLIHRYPQVGIGIMRALAGRLHEAETQLEDLALKSLASRLATLILRRTSPDSGRMAGLTHSDLAERVGTSRETATQALNELKGAELIGIGRKWIEVLDREGLEAVAESY